MHTQHSLLTLSGLPGSATDGELNARTREQALELHEIARENGWGEYRAPIALMSEAMGVYDWNDGALLKLNEKIKAALDPNGIIAPGKNGIWPESFRDQRGQQA